MNKFSCYPVQQQGEVYIRRIDRLPDGVKLTPVKAEGGHLIVSHSESGHHHVLDRRHVDLMERADPAEGLRMLYAVVKEHTALRQTAATPHGAAGLEPGIYEMRLSREFSPFEEEISRVAD